MQTIRTPGSMPLLCQHTKRGLTFKPCGKLHACSYRVMSLTSISIKLMEREVTYTCVNIIWSSSTGQEVCYRFFGQFCSTMYRFKEKRVQKGMNRNKISWNIPIILELSQTTNLDPSPRKFSEFCKSHFVGQSSWRSLYCFCFYLVTLVPGKWPFLAVFDENVDIFSGFWSRNFIAQAVLKSILTEFHYYVAVT